MYSCASSDAETQIILLLILPTFHFRFSCKILFQLMKNEFFDSLPFNFQIACLRNEAKIHYKALAHT